MVNRAWRSGFRAWGLGWGLGFRGLGLAIGVLVCGDWGFSVKPTRQNQFAAALTLQP